MGAALGLRGLFVGVNSQGDAEATNDGSSLGGEQVDGLLGIDQGFAGPEPGGRR
jgi:hypothetical protein